MCPPCREKHAAIQRASRAARPPPEPGACRLAQFSACTGVADEGYATCGVCRRGSRERMRRWRARQRSKRRLRELKEGAAYEAALRRAERKLRDRRAGAFAGVDRRKI